MVKKIAKELKKLGYKIKMASEIKQSEKIKTGVFALDYVLDGGIYQGEGGHRIELYGKESSCKTTFALQIVAKLQKLGKKCIYINAEQSYDKPWAAKLGVDSDKLYITEPESLEQAGDMLCDLIPEYDLIVVDSIASLIPQEELDGTMVDKKFMASQAKILSPMMRKLYSSLKEHTPTIVFINQLREKVGVMYGNPLDTPGGRAIKHFYNTRVEFRLGKPIQNKDKDKIGYEINLNCTKNKRGKPYRTAVVDFYMEGKIDNMKSLFYSGIKYGLIEQKGSYYSYKEISEQGFDNFVSKLKDKDIEELEKEIWKRIK